MSNDLNNFSEQIGKSLDSETCQRFHIILWEKAAAAYEVGSWQSLYNRKLNDFMHSEYPWRSRFSSFEWLLLATRIIPIVQTFHTNWSTQAETLTFFRPVNKVTADRNTQLLLREKTTMKP